LCIKSYPLSFTGIGSLIIFLSLFFQVVSQPNIMQYFTQCLQSDFNVNIKIAAVRCLISLSRSTKLLRTYLSDVELSLSKLILEMLSSTNENLVSITASLLCNLLLSFCPCRELMIQEGIITVLCCLTIHDNSSIQLNAVWSLMNCARNANQDVVREIRLGLPINQLLELYLNPISCSISLNVYKVILMLILKLQQ
jgi:hypothetical protein